MATENPNRVGPVWQPQGSQQGLREVLGRSWLLSSTLRFKFRFDFGALRGRRASESRRRLRTKLIALLAIGDRSPPFDRCAGAAEPTSSRAKGKGYRSCPGPLDWPHKNDREIPARATPPLPGLYTPSDYCSVLQKQSTNKRNPMSSCFNALLVHQPGHFAGSRCFHDLFQAQCLPRIGSEDSQLYNPRSHACVC